MRLAVTFYLGDLGNRLPTHARFGIILIERVSVECGGVPHQPITEIAVVRNRQRLAPGQLFVLIQCGPKMLGVT